MPLTAAECAASGVPAGGTAGPTSLGSSLAAGASECSEDLSWCISGNAAMAVGVDATSDKCEQPNVCMSRSIHSMPRCRRISLSGWKSA
eukprot:1188308-Alexandrium_andersonii.AAC.1